MSDAMQIVSVLLWFWTAVAAFAFVVVTGQFWRNLRSGLADIDKLIADWEANNA